jgi:hypothetical protein
MIRWGGRPLCRRLHHNWEAPVALLQRISEARERAQQERIEQMVPRLEDANREREAAVQLSFWKQNLRRAARHPFLTGAPLVMLTLTVLSSFAFSAEPVSLARPEELVWRASRTAARVQIDAFLVN